MADEHHSDSGEPISAIPLSYEPPAGKSKSPAVAVVLIVLFICGTSLGLFAIEASNYRRSDSWPAAIATLGLSLMGSALGYFMTRAR